MKCEKCGKEWSARVYYIHIKDCNAEPVTETKEPIKVIEHEIIETVSEEIEIPNIDLTKPMIIQELKRKEIPHNGRDKKEDLLKILNDSKEAV